MLFDTHLHSFINYFKTRIGSFLIAFVLKKQNKHSSYNRKLVVSFPSFSSLRIKLDHCIYGSRVGFEHLLSH